MSLPLATLVAGVGAAVLGGLGLRILRDPAAGLAWATHRAEQLPQVLAGRYLALAAIALAAALSQQPAAIATVFAVLALVGLFDARLYAAAGQPYLKHLIAGIGAALVAAIALSATLKTGVSV